MAPSDHYDVIIVGGGINGVGVAQAAAAGGHSVLLLEQTALAAGTSSRSSKLIHGGLRYLEKSQYSLVRESLRERATLLQLAPELVRLVPFHIPIYRSTRRRPLVVRAGLMLYALLGGLAAENRFRTVPPREWDALDGIDTKDLQIVYCYSDGQTDDAALTRAVMKSAQSLGAELMSPARFIGAHLESGGCTVHFLENHKARSCRSAVLVNAAGPWVNRVLDAVTPAPPKLEVDLIRGTHILVEGQLQRGIYYLETPQDGRAIFAMPRDGATLVGTTEAVHEGDPASVQAPPSEQHYLMEALAHYFPAYRNTNMQVVRAAYAGLRVLPKGPGRAFDRPRDTVFAVDRDSHPRLLTIYGGKLTTYRATAAKVMQRLETSLPRRKARADTGKLPLTPA